LNLDLLTLFRLLCSCLVFFPTHIFTVFMDSLAFFLTKLFGIIFSILKFLSMSLCFRAFIKKKGKNNVTVDDLIHVITPKGRGRGSSVSEVYLLLSTQDNLLVYLLFSRIQM
jgi:hypothetical protein